jgi:hypothetical protein
MPGVKLQIAWPVASASQQLPQSGIGDLVMRYSSPPAAQGSSRQVKGICVSSVRLCSENSMRAGMNRRLTRAEGRELLARLSKPGQAARKPSKYRNRKVQAHDEHGNVITIDSKAEARRWGHLLVLNKQGLIKDLKRQLAFEFGTSDKSVTYKSNRAVRYLADFSYVVVETGKTVFEDVKSDATRTDAYKIKWALVRFFYGIEISEVT